MPMQGIPITATQAATVGQPIYHLGATGTLHDHFTAETSTNGSSSTDKNGTALSTDGSGDESAVLGTRILTSPGGLADGLLYAYWHCRFNQAPADLANAYVIGFAGSTGNPRAVNGAAGFDPAAGAQADGNVFIRTGGADVDGQADLSGLAANKYHTFGVVIDFEESVTKFYFDSNALSGAPDAEIGQVPDAFTQPAAGMDDPSDANETMSITSLTTGMVL